MLIRPLFGTFGYINRGKRRIKADTRIYDFKETIHTLTRVPIAVQKIIGLTKGKLSPEMDSKRFGSLGLKRPGGAGVIKFTLVGTPEELRFKDPGEVILPQVSASFLIFATYCLSTPPSTCCFLHENASA